MGSAISPAGTHRKSPYEQAISGKKVALASAVVAATLVVFYLFEKIFFVQAAPLNERKIDPLTCATGISQAVVEAKKWITSIEVLHFPLISSWFVGKATQWISYYCNLHSWTATSSDLEEQLEITVKSFDRYWPKDTPYVAVVREKKAFSRALCTSLTHLPTEVVTLEGITLELLKGHNKVAIFVDPLEDFLEELARTLEGFRYLNKRYEIAILSLLLPELDPIITQDKQIVVFPHDQKLFFAREYIPTPEQNKKIFADITKQWKSFVQWHRRSPLHRQLKSLADAEVDGTYEIFSKKLIPRSFTSKEQDFFRKEGTTFFLSNLVIKPLQEDCLIVGNPYSPDFTSYAIRRYPNVPSYQDAFRRVAVSKIAHLAGMGSIVPQAELAIIKTKYFETKLCSIEEFIPNAKTLLEARNLKLIKKKHLNPAEVKMYMFFILLIHNSDPNPMNVLVQFIKKRPHLVSVDHDSAFPLKNGFFTMPSVDFWPLDQKLGPRDVKIIKNFPFEKACQILKEYGLENTISAFEKRYSALKKLVKPGKILREVYEKITSTVFR